MASDDDCGGYDSCGDDGDYGSYNGDDGQCYDDSANYGSYEDEAGHYVKQEVEEDYEACNNECDDSFASSQEHEDGDASRYVDPTYSSCDDFELDGGDMEGISDNVKYMDCSSSSSLGVSNVVQGSSRVGGFHMGKGRLAYPTRAKGLDVPSSHMKGGLRDGVALATNGVDCFGSGGKSGATGYGPKAGSTCGVHRGVPSPTFNNTSNVGRVKGSGSNPSGIATSGGIRKAQVVGVDTLEHPSPSLDLPIRDLVECRFVVEVDGFGGNLLKIGDMDVNCISTSLVKRQKTKCQALKYPYEYEGVWVSMEARVLISHRGYKEYIWCDVCPMPCFDVWLGDPWMHDKRFEYIPKRDVFLMPLGQWIYDVNGFISLHLIKSGVGRSLEDVL